jgi:hypothetical protein
LKVIVKVNQVSFLKMENLYVLGRCKRLYRVIADQVLVATMWPPIVSLLRAVPCPDGVFPCGVNKGHGRLNNRKVYKKHFIRVTSQEADRSRRSRLAGTSGPCEAEPEKFEMSKKFLCLSADHRLDFGA